MNSELVMSSAPDTGYQKTHFWQNIHLHPYQYLKFIVESWRSIQPPKYNTLALQNFAKDLKQA